MRLAVPRAAPAPSHATELNERSNAEPHLWEPVLKDCRRVHRLMLLLSAAFISLLAGCSGRGSVSAIPFMRSDFGPTEPAVQTVEINEAHYWLDDDGALNIALRYHAPSRWGKAFEANWLLSLALEGLPAGSEKLYHLGSRSIRQVCSQRGIHQRCASLMGVAVVQAPRDGWLEGRFHVVVRRQQFNALTGWTPVIYRAPRIVMAGTFKADHDPVRGRAIRTRATADGFGHLSLGRRRISTRPVVATRPAATRKSEKLKVGN